MSFSRNSGCTGMLVEFFSNNPDEELTLDDICAKFEMKRRTASSAIYKLKKRGVLELVQVYRSKPSPHAVKAEGT